jgi:hypothetical protein
LSSRQIGTKKLIEGEIFASWDVLPKKTLKKVKIRSWMAAVKGKGGFSHFDVSA